MKEIVIAVGVAYALLVGVAVVAIMRAYYATRRYCTRCRHLATFSDRCAKCDPLSRKRSNFEPKDADE